MNALALERLRAIVLGVWSALHPHACELRSAPVIADAIALAAAEDLARGYVDAPLEAALLAFYAWKESRLEPDAVGDKGRSCGAWQERCELAAGRGPYEQARMWLAWVHEGGLAGVDSSPERARARFSRVLGVLATLPAPEPLVARRPPPMDSRARWRRLERQVPGSAVQTVDGRPGPVDNLKI